MADKNTTEEYLDDGTKNPDYKAPAGEGDDKSKNTEKDKDKKEGEDDDKGGDDKDKTKDDPEFDDDAEPVVPIRRSAAQHIIARKNKKIEKLESKDKNKDDDKGDDPEEDEEDGDLTDDARKAIDKGIEKRIAPIKKILVSEADAQELKELFADEPEAKKYEKHIKAYMGHDVYKGVSPEVIYHHLAFNASIALGAKQKKVADKEADLNKNGGRTLAPKGSVGDLPSAEDIAAMSDDEFAEMETKARQGKYLLKK